MTEERHLQVLRTLLRILAERGQGPSLGEPSESQFAHYEQLAARVAGNQTTIHFLLSRVRELAVLLDTAEREHVAMLLRDLQQWLKKANEQQAVQRQAVAGEGGSPVLEELRDLAEAGVRLVVDIPVLPPAR
jgi:hypothetical protein